MIFDTDVLIWCLRGHARAADAVDAAPERAVSIVTWMELVQGARDRKELGVLRAFLVDLGFATLPLSENIGHRAAVYMETYALRVDLGVADAFIAATAAEHARPLCTGNAKHYRPIGELPLTPFRP